MDKLHGTIYKFPVIDYLNTGRHLRDCCASRGFTAKNLAEILGISQQSVYKWFRGECFCDIDNLLAISVLLDEPIDNLVKRKQG